MLLITIIEQKLMMKVLQITVYSYKRILMNLQSM